MHCTSTQSCKRGFSRVKDQKKNHEQLWEKRLGDGGKSIQTNREGVLFDGPPSTFQLGTQLIILCVKQKRVWGIIPMRGVPDPGGPRCGRQSHVSLGIGGPNAKGTRHSSHPQERAGNPSRLRKNNHTNMRRRERDKGRGPPKGAIFHNNKAKGNGVTWVPLIKRPNGARSLQSKKVCPQGQLTRLRMAQRKRLRGILLKE